MKSFLCCVLCLLLLFAALPPVAQAESVGRIPPCSHTALVTPDNLVASDGALEMYMDTHTLDLAVYQPATGYVWSSAVDTTQYTEEIFNVNGLRTFLSLTVAGKTNQEVMAVAGSTGAGSTATCKRITNGVRVDVALTARQIRLTVELTLEDNTLKAHIPADSVEENGDYSLVSIALLPTFGAARGDQDGYLFFPDGSGSLIELEQTSGTAYPLILPFYGDEQADAELLTRQREQGLYALTCPVFGIKADDMALFGNITAGDADASLYLAPGGYVYPDLFRSYVAFHVHRSYSYTDNAGATQYVVDPDAVVTDRTVEYHFLTGDRANYGGMAAVYRDYLMETYERERLADEDSLPLILDLFMGTGKDGFLFRQFVSTTTYAQAEELLTDLKAAGVEDLQAELLGWSAGGYDAMPTASRPAWQLGGKRGLASLIERCEEQGIGITLQYDLLLANQRSGSYNTRQETVRNYPGIIVSSLDKLWHFLTGRSFLERYATRPLEILETYPHVAVSVGNTGSYLFSSYSRNGTLSRQESLNAITEGLDTLDASADFRVRNGNIYAVARSTAAINLPDDHSGYTLSDRAVPFYQMVLHGWIPYTTVAGNNAYDLTRQMLRWAEMGALPYFELTWENGEDLKGTEYAHLLSSQYSQWKDTAVEIWRQFNADFAALQDQTITAHTVLTEDVVRVTYEDGTRVYVNYTALEGVWDGVTVPATGYIVVRGEEAP